MPLESTKVLHLECGCRNPAHLIRVQTVNFEWDAPELEVSVQLNHYLPWHKRLVAGVKYIFGLLDTNEYDHSHFDTICLSANDADRLWVFLHQFRADRLNHELQAKANASDKKRPGDAQG